VRTSVLIPPGICLDLLSTSAAKAAINFWILIAALKRCATQEQILSSDSIL